jgi:excinuclease ABC subunit A
VPDQSEALNEAIEPWRKNGRRMNMFYGRMLRNFCDRLGVPRDVAYDKLPKNAKRMLLEGTNEADEAKLGFSFEGVIPNLHRRYDNSESDFVRERLQQYMSGTPCPVCEGKRLRIEALHVMLKAGVSPSLEGRGRGGGCGPRQQEPLRIRSARPTPLTPSLSGMGEEPSHK